MSDLKKRRTFSAKNLTLIAIFTAIICVVSPFSVPIGAVPISLTSLVIFLCGVTLGKYKGTVAVIVYLLLGAFGLPVFSGFVGGFGVLLGVTGGFIIGYVPCVFITGWLIELFNDKKAFYSLAFLVGTIILYFFGVVFYVIVYKVSVSVALVTCVLPFIIFDIIKIIIATILTIIIKPKLKYLNGFSR